MNKVVIAVSDFDGHICKLGPERCSVCKAKAEFYKISNEKWSRLKAKWEAVSKRSQSYQPDCAVIAAILTPSDIQEEKQHANA
jgi:hypothetical protein